MASSYGGNCVSYVRAVTGMEISGNAGAWWGNAAGRYSRGQAPVPGSVLVFKPSAAMSLGHVAVVAHVVNKREILVDQANWVPGRVVKDMAVYDVSAANNWSAVRVADYRATAWGRINPTFGFIYPRGRRAPAPPDLIEADYHPDQTRRAARLRLADYEALRNTARTRLDHERAEHARLDRARLNRERLRSAQAEQARLREKHEAAARKLAAQRDRKIESRRREEHLAAAEQTRLRDEREAEKRKLAALRDRKIEARRREEHLASAERERAREARRAKLAARRESVDRSHRHEPVRVAEASPRDRRIVEREHAVERHRKATVHTAARAEHSRPVEHHVVAARHAVAERHVVARRHVAKAAHPAARHVRHVATRRLPEQIAEARIGGN